MKYVLLVGAFLALPLLSGCINIATVRGQQGKAYVVKAHPFGSTIWNCEAAGGQPKCYQVIKQDR